MSRKLPWPQRANSPGLRQLTYLPGRYNVFLERMRSRLPVQPGIGQDQDAAAYPLARLNIHVEKDWTLALLHAWAATLDVLAFYQERIINEGYLRTAVERRSLLELAEAVGYRPYPGQVAKTHLAFSVKRNSDAIYIPQGTAVQSVPDPDATPQTFETSRDLEARSEWNILHPAKLNPVEWPHDSTSARVVGSHTGLQKGDSLLIVGDETSNWQLVMLTSVEVNTQDGYTRLTWNNSKTIKAGSTTITNPKIYRLECVRLFDYTQGGVYWLSATEQTWRPSRVGLRGQIVHDMVSSPSGDLFAATSQGIYQYIALSDSWQLIRNMWTQQGILALTLSHEGHLYAGGEDGRIVCSLDQGRSWTVRSGGPIVRTRSQWLRQMLRLPTRPLPKTVVHSLSIDGQQRLIAGTEDGVFRSRNSGKSWRLIKHHVPKPRRPVDWIIRYRSAGEGENVPYEVQALVAEDVPSPLQKNQIDLDRLYTDVGPGNRVVLVQDEHTLCLSIDAVEIVANQDVEQAGEFSRIIVNILDDAEITNGDARLQKTLEEYDWRATDVFLQREQFTLYDDSPLSGECIRLDGVIPTLPHGRKLIISGERMPTGTARHSLESCDEPLDSAETAISEVVAVKDVFIEQKQTRVVLAAELHDQYDRATVRIFGNVVQATHGETVANEVLGGGNTQHDFPRFILKRRPLTYIDSDTPEGVTDVLYVYVSGVQWHEVASLYVQSRESRVYTVERDVMGNAIVIFGDGEHGAAVPSGSENVTATYRVGLGRAGNVPANRLTLLPRSPAGVQSVTNPITATGGVSRASIHDMRQTIPKSVRGLARIVSLSDYEDFVQQFIGIGKAKAYHLRDGQVELVHITIAGTDGAPVERDSDLYKRLLREIDACRARRFPPVDVGICNTPKYFKLEADVLIIPEHYHRRQTILDQLCEILLREYSFAHREFGQSVTRSEVISTMHRVPGVLAVKMTNFQFKGCKNFGDKDESVKWNLPANSARLDGSVTHPAELILLASCDLKLEVPG